MRYLVFSDSHLTHRFDQNKFNAIKTAVEGADRVVINGDFWDAFSTTFDKFVNSPWKDTLFPVLKQKKTIYIYGNHDDKRYSDKRVELFSTEQHMHYDLKSGDKTFHFEHGNRYVPLFDEWLHTKPHRVVNDLYEHYEGFMLRTFGKAYLKHVYGPLNKQAIKKSAKDYGPLEYLVMGHTHFAELNHPHRFINTGIIKHGLAQYIYIENGEITVVEKKY